jgi:hypothetical protein
MPVSEVVDVKTGRDVFMRSEDSWRSLAECLASEPQRPALLRLDAAPWLAMSPFAQIVTICEMLSWR